MREAAKLAPASYVFVSTISVYRDLADLCESGPVHELADAATVELSLATYGGLKAACERAVDALLPGCALHIRAGLIVGPHDYDRRFRWWLQRIAQGGEVLAPGEPEALAQAIDVRDLADWMVTSAERRLTGIFNAAGEPQTMRQLLETLRVATGSDATFSWVPDSILEQHQVTPYSDMPFWLPASLGAKPADISRALAAGLSLRPLLHTAQDTWKWLQTGWDDEDCVRAHRKLAVPAGITPDQLLSGLTWELRTVFVMFEIEGMSSPEIADVVGVSRGTVASRLRLAREAFARGVQRHRARLHGPRALLRAGAIIFFLGGAS